MTGDPQNVSLKSNLLPTLSEMDLIEYVPYNFLAITFNLCVVVFMMINTVSKLIIQ